MLLLVTSEMVRLFVNTLTTNEKYSRHNRENFRQQIQVQLSQKPKTFYKFSVAFLISTSNSEYLKNEHECHSLSISEISDFERGDYLNV